MKHIFFLFFAIFQLATAQHTITGTFTDSLPNIKDVALYKFENETPKYVNYVEVKKNTFTFQMDKQSKGYYKILYKNTNTGFVDLIYNNEDVKFELDSKVGQPSVNYLASKENQLIEAYNKNILKLQFKLDSIQMTFFKNPKSDNSLYKEVKQKVDGAQKYYEDLAKNNYCLSLIKASKRYNAPIPFTVPEEYLKSAQDHFFDYINFKDKDLQNSDFLKRSVLNYVFYWHQSEDKELEDKQFTQAIQKTMSLIEDNVVKEVVLSELMRQLVGLEKRNVLEQAIAMYRELPSGLQHSKFLQEIKTSEKTMVGQIAPNLQISETKDLYSLSESDKYLVIFWSSSCPHCKKELPEIKKMMQSKTGITVIAVGIEKPEEEKEWRLMIKNMPSWKHVLALGKWESKPALDYNLNATPTYFILDKEKRIIAKPYSLQDLERVLKQ